MNKKLLTTGLTFAIVVSSLSIIPVKADKLTKVSIYFKDGDVITTSDVQKAVNHGNTVLTLEDTSEYDGEYISKVVIMSDFSGEEDKVSLVNISIDKKEYKPYSQSYGKTNNGYSYCTALYSNDFCKISNNLSITIKSSYEEMTTPVPSEEPETTLNPDDKVDITSNPVESNTSKPTTGAVITEEPIISIKPVKPTVEPTIKPTEVPKETPEPTIVPTMDVNINPAESSNPSGTDLPSGTSSPLIIPTEAPTITPTSNPTSLPNSDIEKMNLSISNKTKHSGYKYYSVASLKLNKKGVYTIYRKIGKKGKFKKIKTINGLFYNDKSVTKGKTYYYMVTASGKKAALKNITISKKITVPAFKVKAKGTAFNITFSKAEGDKIQAKYKYRGKKTWSDLSALNCNLKKSITKTLKSKGFTLKIRTVKKAGGKNYYSKWVTKKI